ncbi:MAG TPA: hypothetical protein DEA08_36905 [Planctomycetes bacterium]|nr:hypothetical protein [Planctomycetota bacterium]
MNRPALRAFTVLEIMASVAILSFALFGMLAAINVSGLTRSSAREREVATGLITSVLEQYHGQSPLVISNAIWSSDDLAGNGDTAEQALTITSSTLSDASRSVRVLSEAEAETAAGLAAGTLDLDGDGTAGEDDSNSDRTAYEFCVPLRFTLTWTAQAGGQRTLNVLTFLYVKA